MGLHNTAHYLKTKGRNDDTELVHMTKGEVQALKGLAAKHGGDLTTNPETGLPEAGFLSAILPAVAGIATAAFAPELLPLVAGGIGLADYAITGSLTQGLMAGVSAYGAGGVGEALQTAGDVAAAAEGGSEAVQNAALQSGTQLAAGTAQPGVEAALNPDQIQAMNAINPTNMPNMSPDQLGQLRQAALSAQNPMDVVNAAGMGNVAQSAAITNPTGMQSLSNMGAGITQPGALSGNYGNLAMAAAPILTGALTNNRSTIPTATSTNTNPFGLKTLSPNFQGMFPAQPNPHYQAQYPNYQQNPYQAPSSGIVGMAAGGSVPSYSGEYGSVVGINQATQDLESLYDPRAVISSPTPSVGIVQDTDLNTRNLSPYEAALYRVKQKASAAGLGKNAIALPAASSTYGKINPDATPEVREAAGGGIMGAPSLGGYAAGGNPHLLKGPGDGMSDSIPANIGGKQPARLADGEFVVPADVVSHLGNGSTDAGAKRLYAMMDNIRKARTGRKKQAPEVKADKYLPK